MNFDGFLPHEIPRFSSLVEQDDPTNLPLGVSPLARNVKFHLTSARVRDGIQNQYGFVLPDKGAVTGLAAIKVAVTGQSDLQVPLAFSALGNLYKEAPVGTGNVGPLIGPQVTPPAASSMQAAAAYGKAFLAFSDLKNSKGAPAVYNPLLDALDPLSGKLVGQLWTPGTHYYVGEVVAPPTPVGGTGHTYICTVAGVSGGKPPIFPAGELATVAEASGLTWQESTPVMAQAIPEPWLKAPPVVTRNAGAGTFAAGRDVYILLTYLNGQGETDGSVINNFFKFVNTSLNDQFVVTGPTLAAQAFWVQALQAPYAITGYNVYEADVATGNPAPPLSAYKLVNVAPAALGTNVNVNTSGAGVAPPTINSAVIVPAGNICSGLRYMVVLFLNRNGYITGMTSASVIMYNGSTNGFELYVAHLPIGPPNTVARLVCFTPAGQLNQLAGTGISNAGPYFWIPPAFTGTAISFNPRSPSSSGGSFTLTSVPAGVTIADTVNGVQMTSTLINDNVTTTATFNFTDDYLKATLQDVSPYFRKIQVPNCSDVWWSKTLRRNFYAADNLPSGWYVSLQDDVESVYGDTGLVQVAENNGENRTAIREFKGVVYPMKEKSGYALQPSADDPSTWDAPEQWTGSGPCGPRAVDVGAHFMCYVHRSGVYIFQGTKPFHISKEIPITWSGINWAYQRLIWVLVDDESKEIRIGVPFGQSTVPNLVLKCNYEELAQEELTGSGSVWSEHPIHFSPYVGKEIASGACYKWSIDDIAANCAIRAERALQNPPPLMDNATIQSQILYGSSNADGAVSAIIPFVFDDNGAGIDGQIETAAPQDLMRPNRVGGVQMNIGGYGQGTVELLALKAIEQHQGGPPVPGGKAAADAGMTIVLKKPWVAGIPYSCGARGTNERWRLRVTNNKRAGVWFDLKWASIYGAPVSSARPG